MAMTRAEPFPHIWPIAKHKISLITWTISYFIYCIYYVLTKHVAKPQAYGQQVKGNAIENQNKTNQWYGVDEQKGWKVNINSIRFDSIPFNSIESNSILNCVHFYCNNFSRIIAAFELKCTWMNTKLFNGFFVSVHWFTQFKIYKTKKISNNWLYSYVFQFFLFSPPPPQNWLA